MTFMHYIGAALVILIIIGVGVYSGKQVKSASDYDGGHNASAGLVMGAIIGTLVGGSSTIGTAQLAYTYGFSAWCFTLGGGIGVPPILELAKQMQCEKKQIVVGYRNAQTFLKEEFEAAGELYISTEDGSVGTKGNVMDAIREQKLEADIIYACGPTPMLRAIKQYAEANNIECYISLEERMACGIGACLACVCKSKEKDAHSNVNNKRICKDGPVFLSTEVEI